jgi:hypothetical protein
MTGPPSRRVKRMMARIRGEKTRARMRAPVMSMARLASARGDRDEAEEVRERAGTGQPWGSTEGALAGTNPSALSLVSASLAAPPSMRFSTGLTR